MQRFLTFVVLFLLTVPVGLSLQGCANKNSDYCNGSGYGYQKDQPVSISFSRRPRACRLRSRKPRNCKLPPHRTAPAARPR